MTTYMTTDPTITDETATPVTVPARALAVALAAADVSRSRDAARLPALQAVELTFGKVGSTFSIQAVTTDSYRLTLATVTCERSDIYYGLSDGETRTMVIGAGGGWKLRDIVPLRKPDDRDTVTITQDRGDTTMRFYGPSDSEPSAVHTVRGTEDQFPRWQTLIPETRTMCPDAPVAWNVGYMADMHTAYKGAMRAAGSTKSRMTSSPTISLVSADTHKPSLWEWGFDHAGICIDATYLLMPIRP